MRGTTNHLELELGTYFRSVHPDSARQIGIEESDYDNSRSRTRRTVTAEMRLRFADKPLRNSVGLGPSFTHVSEAKRRKIRVACVFRHCIKIYAFEALKYAYLELLQSRRCFSQHVVHRSWTVFAIECRGQNYAKSVPKKHMRSIYQLPY